MWADHLVRFARGITHADTFEHLVSPALADLQQESGAGRQRRRHYVGLIMVSACAVARALRVDASFVANNDAWRTVWRPSLDPYRRCRYVPPPPA